MREIREGERKREEKKEPRSIRDRAGDIKQEANEAALTRINWRNGAER